MTDMTVIEPDAAQAQKRGPGRPPKVDKVNVTYIPQDGDPAETVWNGLKFHANVPRPVTNPIMIEQAKGNPWFKVEGHEKASSAPRSGTPKTAEEYRAHAVEWFKKAKTASDFDARWDAESEMRDRAGVGTDDLEWLETIKGPRLTELKKQDEK